jgi:ligand-binding sensor domain-containing protein
MRPFSKCFFILIILFVPGNTVAQYFTKYFWADLTTTIPEYKIYCTGADSKGNKWFGTSRGLTMFDGTTWTTYTTADGLIYNVVSNITIDEEDNVWVGTKEGVSKFDGFFWTNYTTANGLVANDVKAIAIDVEGNTWFGTSSGVSKFDGISWKNYTTANGLKSDYIGAIACDPRGAIWFACPIYGGAMKFQNNVWTFYNSRRNTAAENPILLSNRVTDIAIDKMGNVWFVNSAESSFFTAIGATRFDGTTTKDFTFSPYCVDIDSEGVLWFGTRDGIAKIEGDSLTNYDAPLEFWNWGAFSYSVAVDSEGNKWIGTENSGVFMFDGNAWTNYMPNDIASAVPNSRAQDIAIDKDGNKWMTFSSGVSGTRELGGLARFDSTTWNYYGDGWLLKRIALDNQNNVWSVVDHGILKFEGVTWKVFTDNLSDKIVTTIVVDSKDRKWIGTNNGLFQFDDMKWTPYTVVNGLISNEILTIAIDSEDNIWTGTAGGVSKFDGSTWTSYPYAGPDAGSPSLNNVLDIAFDTQGTKWFLTAAGLSEFDDDVFTNHTVSIEGQSVSKLVSIDIDSHSVKWITAQSSSSTGMLLRFDDVSYSKINIDVPGISPRVVIDHEDAKWLVSTGNGIFKYDENNPWINLTSSKTITITAEPNQSFDLQINSNISWKAEASEAWLTMDKSSGLNADEIKITALENLDLKPRKAFVTVKSNNETVVKQITVIQHAAEPVTGVEAALSPVSIYPNPVSNTLAVTSITGENSMEVLLYSLNGTLINRSKTNTGELKIHMDSFSSGLYIIKIISKSDLVTEKIWKH